MSVANEADSANNASNWGLLTILGSFSTTNIIMANWPRAMWQIAPIRAVRTLALGPS
ncbi:hypothetical protein KIN20_016350 [Parelaphostrongylus tenuis]|uniref:Uncharacterized protein n=1 Tax=Parelaphostrongylus tenuis TaxID=148309 RepID=A0AAD5QQM9_PARTN|nr:hypothetical protein KIN20_016350 [Parelaphostrongylus tenuis]